MGNFLLKVKKMSSQNCDSRTDSIRRVSKGRSHRAAVSRQNSEVAEFARDQSFGEGQLYQAKP